MNPERSRAGNSAGALVRRKAFLSTASSDPFPSNDSQRSEPIPPHTTVRRFKAESMSRAVRARELRTCRFASVSCTGEVEVERGMRVVVTWRFGVVGDAGESGGML